MGNSGRIRKPICSALSLLDESVCIAPSFGAQVPATHRATLKINIVALVVKKLAARRPMIGTADGGRREEGSVHGLREGQASTGRLLHHGADHVPRSRSGARP